jgi:hypothetical protein
LGITLVDSPTRSGESAEPHWAQKRLPSGFSWPHRVQCTSVSSAARGSWNQQVDPRVNRMCRD